MPNYKVEVPAVSVPEDWSNFSRDVVVRLEEARSNRVSVVVQESVGAGAESFVFEADAGVDISVSVDLKDGKPAPAVKKTSGGRFYEYSCADFSIVRTDEVPPPPPEPAPEPEPVVEPEPEPVVEPDPEPADDKDADDHWNNLVQKDKHESYTSII